MSTYSHQAQRELDAASFAEDDRLRAKSGRYPVPRGAVAASRKLLNVTVPRDTELDDRILDAIYDALCDADGHPSPYYLRHHLAKRGLLIVEADKYSAALLRSQLVESTVATIKGE